MTSIFAGILRAPQMLGSVAAHVMELVTGDSQIPRASGVRNLDQAAPAATPFQRPVTQHSVFLLSDTVSFSSIVNYGTPIIACSQWQKQLTDTANSTTSTSRTPASAQSTAADTISQQPCAGYRHATSLTDRGANAQ